jgi:tetratricopeptide (TPR) repeat protein
MKKRDFVFFTFIVMLLVFGSTVVWAQEPTTAEDFLWRGNWYYNERGDLDRAIADYTQAIRLNPNYSVAYANRANVYADRKDYNRAMSDWTQALRIDPNDVEVYLNRGYTYLDMKEYDKAITDFNEVIRLNSNIANGRAYYFRGMAYYNKKDYDRAITDFEAALRINPNNSTFKQWIDSAKQARGR